MEMKLVLSALSALAQESRLAIFRYLVETGPGGAPVGTIGDALKLAPATLSFHLKELSRAELVASRQDGRYVWYSANFATMNGLVDYLTRNCCAGQPQLCFPHRAVATTKVMRSKARA
jgi:ArsR family transcriptional regulator, arsenate/arsenite/antimonite-responsive transcriptional repressor